MFDAYTILSTFKSNVVIINYENIKE
jgi:hypothetical protein